ncbi:MAG: type IV secretory system conjugative DNA transfer family protein [Clostridia bacterium]|nr:type IV secretory system conjugative DNA transfer family protein [Clostridia bacterium]
MNYKVKKTLKDNKKSMILIGVLWIILTIILVSPIAKSIVDATDNGIFVFGTFLGEVFQNIVSFNSITQIFGAAYIGTFFKTLLWFSIFYAICTTIGLFRSKPKSEYADIEHGSSDWSEGGEQYKVLSKHKGILLAQENYLPVDKRGNVNVLVVGGSGSGKSASYSIPNAFQMLGSYVFTDPKGELYDKTAGYLRQNGYDIKVLNLVNPANSDGYNPLMHIASELDVDVIANTIVKGQKSESGSDPYWDDMAEMLLKALIYYLIATRPEEEQNLASCSELVRAANANGGSNLLTELMNQLPYDHPARMNYKSIEIAPEKTYGSILSSLQSKLGKFDSKEIAEVTSTDTINFEDIGSKKTAVYVISSDTHTAYDFLLTIFFSQMIQQLYNFADANGGRLKMPTYFICDEFANIGKIPDFDKKISTSRSRGISFSVILQNLDQLEAVYEKSYETIMGNCDTHVFLGSNSFKTVEYFSKALGEKTITRDSRSINRDKQYHRQGVSDSDQVMARPLMTPDELRRMDNDDCIIYEKGIKPVKAKKYYYFESPMARKLAEYTLNHLDFNIGERGKWRKYNPYNPYVEDNDKAKKADLKVESLDDLFEEEPKEKKEEKPQSEIPIENKVEDIVIGKTKQEVEQKQENTIETVNAPILPQEQEEDEVFSIDVQKELEAKFDELFGPMDDE